MIRKFSTFYVGQVDWENIGIEGKPVDGRRYSNDHLISAFGQALVMARSMDFWGYDTLWLAEHHFQHEGYGCIPNILMLSIHLAHQTERLRFGCAFNIAPNWHPLRLAEDYATADILTGGRVTFGVGRGYQTREVETFGSPLLDAEANRDLFEEQVETILMAFNEESFSHHGKYYNIPPNVQYRGYDLKEITLVPRPIHPLEVWQPIVSSTPRGMDFMAKHGMKGIVTWSDELGEGRLVKYRDANAAHGQELELGEGLCIAFSVYLDDSRKKAMRAARPYFEENMKIYAPLRMVRGLTDEQIESLAGPLAASTADLPTIEKAAQSHVWLCGSAEDVIADLKEFEKKYPGVEHISVTSAIGTPGSVILEQLERFATEVMPAFIPTSKDTLGEP